MTAHRARTHARHYRTANPVRAVPAHLAPIHSDWLPPGGYASDGTYLDPADDLDAPPAPPAPLPFADAPTAPHAGVPVECNSTAASLSTPLAPTGLPREFNSRAPAKRDHRPTGVPVECNSTAAPFTTPSAFGDYPRNSIAGLPSTTAPALGDTPRHPSAEPAPTTPLARQELPAGLQPAASPTTPPAPCAASLAPDPAPPPITFPIAPAALADETPPAWWGVGARDFDPYAPAIPHHEPADEDVIFHAAYQPTGPESRLVHTALPLRHQIYALHCQGRSISAIARRLRLDRGTVARHLHAVEDLLLAEQTADLARLRLRAVEAQHAVLAAAWDALLCEELNESDASNDEAYPSRRAQLLATAARAARTAAQLQGLFTPAALQAALAATVGAHADAPDGSPTTPTCPTGLPREFNSREPGTPPMCTLPDESSSAIAELAPTTPPAPADLASGSPAPAHGGGGWGVVFPDPAANCGMPASASSYSASQLAGAGLPVECNSMASPTTSPAGRAPASSSLTPAHGGADGGWGLPAGKFGILRGANGVSNVTHTLDLCAISATMRSNRSAKGVGRRGGAASVRRAGIMADIVPAQAPHPEQTWRSADA